MNSGFLTDKVRPARAAATRMDNETYRIRVEDLFRELVVEDGTVDEEVRAQLEQLALLPRKTRYFLRVLNDQPTEVQVPFYRLILSRVKDKDFYGELERHIRHRFYEARDQIKEILGQLADSEAVPALMHVIALTDEGWLAGELIRIVLSYDPEILRDPVEQALHSGDYQLQCLGIYLAGKSKSDPLLDVLAQFYRRPFGEKLDRLERKSYDALMEGVEGASDGLMLRWLRDSSARVRELGVVAAARRRLKASVADLVRLVLVDAKTRSRAAQTLLDFEEEGLLEFSPTDEGGAAVQEILTTAKREPLINTLKDLTREESGAVREVVAKMIRLLPDAGALAGALVRVAVEDRQRSVQLAALETLAQIDQERFMDAAADVMAETAGALQPEVAEGLERLVAATLSKAQQAELEAETERRRRKREEALEKFAGTIESWRHDLE
ncbi:MAG TPA: hypothetical protein VKZ69_10630 [Limnochordales bacterium]|nr:hypothetical protein [Limnochordales bacterium]